MCRISGSKERCINLVESGFEADSSCVFDCLEESKDSSSAGISTFPVLLSVESVQCET